MNQLDGEIMEGGWYLLAVAMQTVVVLLRVFNLIAWPWWIVLLPSEVCVGAVVVVVVYLMITKGNPFQ